jgi:hypothetical protein
MALALALLAILALTFVGLLPVWPFSRDWGYGGAIIVGVILVIFIVLTATGSVPGVRIQ